MENDAAPASRRTEAVVYFVADSLGLTAGPVLTRYGIFMGTLACLALAAFLFGPDHLVGAAISLGLALVAIVFVLVFWLFEESRKRRVTLGKEPPLARDALNPDLRDEALAACLSLFLFIPIGLQAFNTTALHFDVTPQRVYLPDITCDAHAATGPCSEVKRVAQLPTWVLFTVRQFLLTLPIGDILSQVMPVGVTGVEPTERTPETEVDHGFKVVFIGFIGTLFFGLYNRVGGQVQDAVWNLSLSPNVAAGVGPIMLQELANIVTKSYDERQIVNAMLALSKIAKKYPAARGEIRRKFEQPLIDMMRSEGSLKLSRELPRLTAAAEALCYMQSDNGKEYVRWRAMHANESSASRCALIDVLGVTKSTRLLQEIAEKEERPAARNKAQRWLERLNR